jgi:hypothetical protein
MKTWKVVRRTILMVTYIVKAEHEKEAEQKTVGEQPDHEEEEDSETMSIVEVFENSEETA